MGRKRRVWSWGIGLVVLLLATASCGSTRASSSAPGTTATSSPGTTAAPVVRKCSSYSRTKPPPQSCLSSSGPPCNQFTTNARPNDCLSTAQVAARKRAKKRTAPSHSVVKLRVTSTARDVYTCTRWSVTVRAVDGSGRAIPMRLHATITDRDSSIPGAPGARERLGRPQTYDVGTLSRPSGVYHSAFAPQPPAGLHTWTFTAHTARGIARGRTTVRVSDQMTPAYTGNGSLVEPPVRVPCHALFEWRNSGSYFSVTASNGTFIQSSAHSGLSWIEPGWYTFHIAAVGNWVFQVVT